MSTSTIDVERLLDSKDLSDRWRCSPGHIANLRWRGVGPRYVRLGRSILYRLADIVEYENRHTVRTS
jgi:hypothetical protein